MHVCLCCVCKDECTLFDRASRDGNIEVACRLLLDRGAIIEANDLVSVNSEDDDENI